MNDRDFSRTVRAMEGKIRLIQEPDGFYVTGAGMRLPVASYEEGLRLIDEIEAEAGEKSG